MTLFRQIMFAITLLIMLLLLGNLLVSVYNARTYFYEQMQALAEDTATSLGLSISHAAQAKDLAQVNSMVDVIFDRGYYRRIHYLNLAGESLVERERSVQTEGVPQWFTRWIHIPEPAGRAEVVSGWYRLGHIEVVANPGYAYRDLWRVFNEQLWLFAFAAVLCYGAAGLVLKYLLTPLRRVEDQAEAICRREFHTQTELPRTPELRRMVLAMNRMVKKIRAMLQQQIDLTESLYREVQIDTVTELPNRSEFDQRLTAWIDSEHGNSPGAMLLLQIENFKRINDILGRDLADDMLGNIAGVIRELLDEFARGLASRRHGAEFSIFLPGITKDDLENILSLLVERFTEVVLPLEGGENRVIIGAAITGRAQSAGQLLSAADMALREAKQSTTTGWYVLSIDLQHSPIRSASEWRDALERVLEQDKLLLHFQSVFASDGKTIEHDEVLCRLDDSGQLVNASAFWPLAERFGFVEDFDRAMVDKVLQRQRHFSSQRVCINLSPQSIGQTSFMEWLAARLGQVELSCEHLLFETSEQVVYYYDEMVLTQLTSLLRQHHVGFSLDHFGLQPAALGYLQNLAPTCVKIDRRFVRDIHRHRENQFYVKTLIQIAHSCDIKIFAEGVETETEWQCLGDLGVDGGQGYWLAKPGAPLL